MRRNDDGESWFGSVGETMRQPLKYKGKTRILTLPKLSTAGKKDELLVKMLALLQLGEAVDCEEAMKKVYNP